MKDITIKIVTLFILASCQNNTVSDLDKKEALELNNQALEFMIRGELDEAEKLYKQAFEIDKTNLNIHYDLLGIYKQRKQADKALEHVNELSKAQKKTVYYYTAKAEIYALDGKMEKSKENYIKAYELSDVIEIKNEYDLNTLVGYAMIETYAGYKEKAVNRINEALKIEWLNEVNKDYLETFRNEFEFYQANGTMEFQSKTEMIICTKNIDSLEQFLKKHHINISGSSTPIGNNKLGEVRVNDKYRNGIEKLGITLCE